MCNKVKHLNKADAVAEVRRVQSNRGKGMGNRHLRPYRCGQCGYFHLTTTTKKMHRTKMRSYRGARA